MIYAAPDAAKGPAASPCGAEVGDGARETLNDGARLVRYARKVIATRSPTLWRRLRKQCIRDCITAVEALLEAVKLAVDYGEYEKYARKKGRSYTLADHVERCIRDWLHHRKLKNESTDPDPREVLAYHTQRREIKAVVAERVFWCPECGERMTEVDYGDLLCPKCDEFFLDP